jgi:translation elongation factor P/translation initiation factor 5A
MFSSTPVLWTLLCLFFCLFASFDGVFAFNNVLQYFRASFIGHVKRMPKDVTMLQLSTSDFKTGLNIELGRESVELLLLSIKDIVSLHIDGVPVKILEFLHVKPGKGAAFVRSKVKNLLTGSVQEKTFRAGETVLPADVLKSEMKYSYEDGDNLCFLDMETFDETRVNKNIIENWKLLNEGNLIVYSIYSLLNSIFPFTRIDMPVDCLER